MMTNNDEVKYAFNILHLIRAIRPSGSSQWHFSWTPGENRMVAPTLHALGSHIDWFDTIDEAKADGVRQLEAVIANLKKPETTL
jgi:hypothetical protein